jgi:hypothetical protein
MDVVRTCWQFLKGLTLAYQIPPVIGLHEVQARNGEKWWTGPFFFRMRVAVVELSTWRRAQVSDKLPSRDASASR